MPWMHGINVWMWGLGKSVSSNDTLHFLHIMGRGVYKVEREFAHDHDCSIATFSPGYQHIASVTRSTLSIWDLHSGVRLHDIVAEEAITAVQWRGESNLLIGTENGYLFSVHILAASLRRRR